MSSIRRLSEYSEYSQTSDDDTLSEDISEGDYNLSIIQAYACVSVLEEATDQLEVLSHLGDLPKIEADLTYKSPQARFGKPPAITVYDHETIEPIEVALYKEKFSKFQVDRSFVEKILKETIKNLMKENSYECMIKYLGQYNMQTHDEAQILKNEKINKTKLNEMKVLLEKERRESFSAIQRLSETIGNLKDQVEDLIIENKIKKVYIENWENSRTEQNNYALDKQEEYYIDIINQKKSDIEKEIRIDAEIEAFIRETQHDHEEAIQMWMERYDKGIEQKDMDIQTLKAQREEQMNYLHELMRMYDDHKFQIEEYLAEKERLRLEAELLKKMMNAATKIQTWWRSIMVKRGFGAFSADAKQKQKKKK